ncbi:MAG: hypothetical protein HGA87_04300 [Desulfobulbaceae bacterium]|nr:hypothetical protein [Desulfobulbaceae bacterium]
MSAPEPILNHADMELSRTPRELCDWVDSIAIELSKTSEGKTYARSGALLPKKFWEEVRPLGLFALCRYGDVGVQCTPNLTNDNYDAKIEFSKPATPPVYIEMTYAKNGQDERLRLEVLTKEGNVNALGKITVSGTKASGRTIKVENEAVDHTKVRQTALDLVKERLAGKCKKQYGKNYILVVIVDDYLPFRTDEDKEVLMRYTQAALSELKPDVGAVYLLGSSGAYCARVSGEI